MRGIRTFIRFAWSLFTTAAILAGSAFLLARWAGWPLPDHLPTSDDVSALLHNPQAPAVVKAFVACAAWILWLSLLAAVIVQAWLQRSRRPPRWRLPRPIQVVTAGLFGIGALNLVNPTSNHDVSPVASAAATAERVEPLAFAAATRTSPLPDMAARQPDDLRPPGVLQADGVDVPDGWITWPLASGILASSAAALLNGTQPTSASALVRSLRAARHPPFDPSAGLDVPADADDITSLEDDAAAPATLTITPDGLRLGEHVVPRTGVGFAGPGADDALRGLLASVAVTTTPAKIVTTQDLFARLASAHANLPNVTTVSDLAHAAHLVQLEIGTRYATTGQSGPADASPAIILVADPPADHAHMTALATLGHPLGIYVVIHGTWAEGATWQIDQNGYATDHGQNMGRLNKLSRTALNELTQLFNIQPPPRTTTTAASPADATTPSLRLCILGKPRLVAPSQPAPRVRRSGTWQAATYLALRPDGASRTDLIETIFGDMKSIEAATASLNTCLHELRRALTIDGRSALVTVDGGYLLDHNKIDVDWWQLQAHLQHGELATAVSFYQGPVAQGNQWDWLPEYRQAVRRTAADAYALLAASAEDPHNALRLALAGIEVDPYAQDCYEAAIRAHLQAGNHGGAHMILRDLRQRLTRSRADINPAIKSLMAQTSRDDTT